MESLKRAWQSGTRTQLSKWTGWLNCLDTLVYSSVMALAIVTAYDLATSLGDMAQAEASSAAALLPGLRRDLPTIWCGLLLFVLSLVFKQIVLSRTKRLELRITQLSIDIVISLLGATKRHAAPRYLPGMWMATDNKACNRRVAGPAMP